LRPRAQPLQTTANHRQQPQTVPLPASQSSALLHKPLKNPPLLAPEMLLDCW